MIVSVGSLLRWRKAFPDLIPHPNFWNTENSNVQNANTQIQGLNNPCLKKHVSFTVYLLERRINCMTIPSIVEAVRIACAEGKKITVAHYNVHSFNLSMQLPWYYEFLQNADIVNCDSVGILKAISYMGLDLPLEYRASYTLLMPKVLENCNQNKFSVFLLGGKPQHLQAALERLTIKYPNTRFVGHHGYFNKEDSLENQAVIEQINQVKPNILVVGMGMPIQESWVQKHRDSLQVNAIMIGGAIIDRMAGVVSDCPQFISNVGFEWLYRLCREPKRLGARYLLGNPAFALHIALAKFYASLLRVEIMASIDNSSLKNSTDLRQLSAVDDLLKKFLDIRVI